MSARRVPVQEDPGEEPIGYGRMPPGTVERWEHDAAWVKGARWHRERTAEEFAEAGGFVYGELVNHLGHEPTTWRALGTPEHSETPPATVR